MKALLLLVSLLVSQSAFAAESIRCRGNESFGTVKEISFSLTPVEKSVNDVEEGEKVPYLFTLTNGNNVWAKGTVMASQEDVMFMFKSRRNADFGKLEGTVYMDELDQSWVSLNGNKYHLDCGF